MRSAMSHFHAAIIILHGRHLTHVKKEGENMPSFVHSQDDTMTELKVDTAFEKKKKFSSEI